MGEVGLHTCVENFASSLSTYCGIDHTWGDKWVKDFEVMSGILTTDCVACAAFGGQL